MAKINQFLRHPIVAGYLAFWIGVMVAGIGLWIFGAMFLLIRVWLGYSPLPTAFEPWHWNIVIGIVCVMVLLCGSLCARIHLRRIRKRRQACIEEAGPVEVAHER